MNTNPEQAAGLTRRRAMLAVLVGGASVGGTALAGMPDAEALSTNDALLAILAPLARQASEEFVDLYVRWEAREDVGARLQPSEWWMGPLERTKAYQSVMALLPADTPAGVLLKESAVDERDVPFRWGHDGQCFAALCERLETSLRYSIEADRARLVMPPSGRNLKPVEQLSHWERF